MARIVLNDVRKTYGTVEAIRGVSLDIADGELIVLVGPSGCGKSTLLRMIAGLEGITGGTISIGDRVVNHLEPSERDIAMVFQNYALYPHMTVRQNLAYGLKNRNTPKPEIDRRIAAAAKALEIEPFLERKPRQLSGGQRQRVAMGRAIVREPPPTCSTSRFPISMPSCGCRCASKSSGCSARWQRPASMSPTTRWRR